jgi:hypothetical protein
MIMSLPNKHPHIVWRQEKVTMGARTAELLQAVLASLPADENPYVLAQAEQTCRRSGDLEALQALRTYRMIMQRSRPPHSDNPAIAGHLR